MRPGQGAGGLTKRIDGTLTGVSVFDPATLDDVLKLVSA
ncbi:hypothetical protein B7760_00450 [Burkholderia glumae]|nr:hypothetical protein B7760_00450 [Burkholderia glumae]